MDKNSILSQYCGQVVKSSPKQFDVIKNCLTKNTKSAYFIKASAKNTGRDLQPDNFKMHSRILRGFFCVRNKRHCATMTDCAGEPSGSPLSLKCGIANPVQSVTFRFATKMTVSQNFKETSPCL
jgi:hypothetical protein